MKKKVLILTAEKTGNGHKSSANAIDNNLKKFGYETMQVDSFTTMGKLGMSLENSYIPVTTKFPILFYVPFLFTQLCPSAMHYLIYLKFRKKFKKIVEDFDPDLIISVHAMFNGAVTHFIKKENLNIPFYINVIDLVNPPKTWFNRDSDVSFVPTDKVKKSFIDKGFKCDSLVVSGFPIRTDIKRRFVPKSVDDKVNILLVNPSVNLKKGVKFVKEVSRLENASVTVICGRDERLYNFLVKEQSLGRINKDVVIHGFVNNMNEFLDNSHILLTKAGPNMILEGTRSGTAVVVTGHILGQENRNFEYVVDNGFGFKCENPNLIYNELKNFIESGKINDCLRNVLNADYNDGAEIIAKFVNDNI